MQHRRFLFLESFFGGSHRAFAEGLTTHSDHTIELMTLPDENWRWRTRAAALQFADRIAAARALPPPSTDPAARPLDLSEYDGIIASDLLTVSDLRALTTGPPVLLYVHESQMTYPLPKGETVDAQTAFADIRNVLMADHAVFNSAVHRQRFLERAGAILESAPIPELVHILEALDSRSSVLHPGCELDALLAEDTAAGVSSDGPLIIWNHRWEYDKNPAPFFRTLETLAGEGLPFRVAVLGENPQYHPKEFEAARETLGKRIVHYGYVADRHAYEAVLREGDIVISTSVQENFGISVVEAVAAGCAPLLPRRLSYPEIIPEQWHGACLYGSNRELVDRLRHWLRAGPPELPGLREAMRRYDWRVMAGRYDRLLSRIAGR